MKNIIKKVREEKKVQVLHKITENFIKQLTTIEYSLVKWRPYHGQVHKENFL